MAAENHAIAERFLKQMARLKIRFGKNAFDEEFQKLLWNLVKDADGEWFPRTVDCFIAERKHTMPPLLVDFREALLRSEKRKSNVLGFTEFLQRHSGDWSKETNILNALGGVKDGYEAMQVLIQKKKTNKAMGFDEYHGLEVFRP